MFHGYYYGPGMMNAGWGNPFFGLISVLFWIVVIWLVVSLIRHGQHSHQHHDFQSEPQDPIDLAKVRYAKGDITKAEFDEIKKTLQV